MKKITRTRKKVKKEVDKERRIIRGMESILLKENFPFHLRQLQKRKGEMRKRAVTVRKTMNGELEPTEESAKDLKTVLKYLSLDDLS